MDTKFVPFTVSVIPAALQAAVVLGDLGDEVEPESEVMVGSTIENGVALDVFALAVGLATATCTVSTVLRFAAVTAALSCVGLT